MPPVPVARIAYGKGRLPLAMDPAKARWRLIEPKPEPALPDPRAAFAAACRSPVGAPPLREIVKPGEKIVVVTSDGTRPVPNRLLIPWLLEEAGAADADVTVVLGTGTHRVNTPEEIDAMFGAETARRLRIVNHWAFDDEANPVVATMRSGARLRMNRLWLEADRRIVVGFIEPHFFAGFSGGPKGIVPGVCGIETILHLHGYKLIADPNSAYGVIDGNPIQAEIREMAAHCPPCFMVNVTLNAEKQITGVYAGDYLEAHRAGCERVRETAMARVERRFPVVVTSNSGFPLDQNLYQTIKGLSAAARIAEDGGVIFVASECADGIPAHGNFGKMLESAGSPEEVLEKLRTAPKAELDQWQAHILADIQRRCRVVLHSALNAGDRAICKLPTADDLQGAVEERLRELGPEAEVAVLPEGPITIPYVAA